MRSWSAGLPRWRSARRRAPRRRVSCSLRPVEPAHRARLERLTRDGGRLVVVETSSLPEYASTRAFYERRGYTRGATVPGYYAPDDDLVIYFKDLANGVLARAPA